MIATLTDTVARIRRAGGGWLTGPSADPAWRWRGEVIHWIDAAVAFLALEKALILRNVRIIAGSNISRAFIGTVRLFVVIDAHIYLYWVIARQMPGTISFLDYNAGGFALWTVFSAMTHKAVSPQLGASFNAALNVRWINLFIADYVWELTKVLLALVLVYTQFIVFPERSISQVGSLPNFPLLLSMLTLVALLGSGLGLVLSSARKRWPVIDATIEAAMWFLFVTSGIYESYVQLPPLIGDYFRLNPVMVIIEYSRVAFDKGYPVGDLDLLYPVVFTLVLLSIGLLLRDRTRAVRI
jgi:ABC-type polysaccharide/polyol phosphate export permease